MDYTILMADIENSRNYDGKVIMRKFKKLVDDINCLNHSKIKSPLTITLGDEFQGIARSVQNGIELIFTIEEFLIQEKYDFKLRYSLHYGPIDSKINRIRAHEMLGSGLTIARENLIRIKKGSSRFSINIGHQDELNSILNKAFQVYQKHIDSWTVKDLEVVSTFLKYQDYKSVASHINTDTSSAWRRKKSLRITEYQSMKEIILFLSKK